MKNTIKKLFKSYIQIMNSNGKRYYPFNHIEQLKRTKSFDTMEVKALEQLVLNKKNFLEKISRYGNSFHPFNTMEQLRKRETLVTEKTNKVKFNIAGKMLKNLAYSGFALVVTIFVYIGIFNLHIFANPIVG